MADFGIVRKSRGTITGDNAHYVLEQCASGRNGAEIHRGLQARGCDVSERAVQMFIRRHGEQLAEMARTATAAATQRGFGVRGRRIAEYDRLAQALAGSLPGVRVNEDLPRVRELVRVLQAIREECNDLDPPAQKQEHAGTVIHEIRRVIVDAEGAS